MAFKDPSHQDRIRAAQEAKKAALEKFRVKASPDNPETIARQKERQAVLAAREERRLAREALAAEKAAQEGRERELAAIRLKEELDRKDRERAEEEERERLLEAEKKAERDARYAARKARKKK